MSKFTEIPFEDIRRIIQTPPHQLKPWEERIVRDIQCYQLRQFGLKEFIFSTFTGSRYFHVLGKDLKDTERIFMKIDVFYRKVFTLDDMPVRYERKESHHENSNHHH